ncbi:MAG: hypothetical protein MMC23_000543 [Stictis urceolatum]|nr:hypothetical protein [Stictis urceolata]
MPAAAQVLKHSPKAAPGQTPEPLPLPTQVFRPSAQGRVPLNFGPRESTEGKTVLELSTSTQRLTRETPITPMNSMDAIPVSDLVTRLGGNNPKSVHDQNSQHNDNKDPSSKFGTVKSQREKIPSSGDSNFENPQLKESDGVDPKIKKASSISEDIKIGTFNLHSSETTSRDPESGKPKGTIDIAKFRGSPHMDTSTETRSSAAARVSQPSIVQSNDWPSEMITPDRQSSNEKSTDSVDGEHPTALPGTPSQDSELISVVMLGYTFSLAPTGRILVDSRTYTEGDVIMDAKGTLISVIRGAHVAVGAITLVPCSSVTSDDAPSPDRNNIQGPTDGTIASQSDVQSTATVGDGGHSSILPQDGLSLSSQSLAGSHTVYKTEDASTASLSREAVLHDTRIPKRRVLGRITRIFNFVFRPDRHQYRLSCNY